MTGSNRQRTRHGGLIFASANALDETTGRRVPEAVSIADETAICIERLSRSLAGAGSSLEDLKKVNCYLSQDCQRAEFWQTWDSIFAPVKAKAIRLTQVAGLADGCRVQLDAIAVSSDRDAQS